MATEEPLPAIADAVREFRRLASLGDRTRRLQVLIGEPSSSPRVLEWRARLVTALTEAHLWPHDRPIA